MHAQRLAAEFLLDESCHDHPVRPGLARPDRVEQAEADDRQPAPRVCQPEDVANAVRWLVSERAGYVTGEKLKVWGGGPG